MRQPRVGNCLKALRKQHGMTQAQLAEQVGVARQSIIAIEKGYFLPSIETALRLSALFKVPVEKIFYLKDTPP